MQVVCFHYQNAHEVNMSLVVRIHLAYYKSIPINHFETQERAFTQSKESLLEDRSSTHRERGLRKTRVPGKGKETITKETDQ